MALLYQIYFMHASWVVYVNLQLEIEDLLNTSVLLNDSKF